MSICYYYSCDPQTIRKELQMHRVNTVLSNRDYPVDSNMPAGKIVGIFHSTTIVGPDNHLESIVIRLLGWKVAKTAFFMKVMWE